MLDLNEITVKRGDGEPLSVNKKTDDLVQISTWIANAKDCSLCLYFDDKIQKIPMFSMKYLGLDDIFSISLEGKNIAKKLDGIEYDFVTRGKHYVDPFAHEIVGREKFAKRRRNIRARFVFDDSFDWSDENRKKIKDTDMIMYQCHVRGFTKHNSSGVSAPGTFKGLAEKIPYLKDLGVNTLILMPIYEFNECMGEKDELKEKTKKKINYWGYTNDAFYFAPKSSYCSNPKKASLELKTLVRELHNNGINIIMDMYFWNMNPSNIIRCLQFYILKYHVDGFRINKDCIDTNWLTDNPILKNTHIFTNSCDDGRLNKQGMLYEMNDGFLVDARRFLKSDEGQVEKFYYRFKEQKKNGAGIVHYITSNNGFTLRDLISYDVKHNEANEEKNQDGTEFNYSWNCGYEGPTRRKSVLKIRKIQERNSILMLMLGLSIPMLLAGDEFGNSQKGNNNAYCQDNKTTWLDWKDLEKNRETYDFVKKLIAFRKKTKLYHSDRIFNGIDSFGRGVPDVSSHGLEPWNADFSYYSRELGIMFYGEYFNGKTIYFAFNFHWNEHEFFLPSINNQNRWKVLIDTAGKQVDRIEDGVYNVAPRSIAIFEAIDDDKKVKKSDNKKDTKSKNK